MSDIFMQTASGRRLDLLEPQADSIFFDDIAWALSNINRFTGHLDPPYSVAAHSYYAARTANAMHYPIDTVRWALMHDAAEAYIGDISKPMKVAIGPIINQIERNILQLIGEVFGLPRFVPKEVGLIDDSLRMAEAKNFLGGPKDDWPNQPDKLIVLDAISPLSSTMSYHLFMGYAMKLDLI